MSQQQLGDVVAATRGLSQQSMGVVALDRPYISLSLWMMLSKGESPLPFLKKNFKKPNLSQSDRSKSPGGGGKSAKYIYI